MKIMELVSGAEINGAVVHCALLSRELARRGHNITLLCRSGAKVKQMVEGAGIEILESDMHRWPFDELRRVSVLARDRQIQILHTHMTRAHNFGVMLRRFAHIPCVATAHSHIVQPLTFMFNDHVIAVSEATRRFQQRQNMVRAGHIETVYGFMDYDRYALVTPEAGKQVRAELGVDNATPLFGIIGDVIPRKGHLYLVRALPEIFGVVPEARLVVIGEPKRKEGKQYFERVKSEAQRLGVDERILWTGYRTDIPQVMKALDIYVMASLDEMFPVAALEAMAAQLPIVATEVGGIPECLKSGETAILIPSADSAALGRAIVQLLQNPSEARRLAERARIVARDNFSLQSQAPRIEAVFERVIERAGTKGKSAGDS